MRRACLAAATAVVVWACGPAGGASDDADDVESASAELSTGARVCSWNIRRLGHQFDSRPKDMKVTASIIKRNCDVLAAQEVMQNDGVATGHEELLHVLGDGWVGVVTSKAQPDDPVTSNSENYAFYIRKSRASLCPDWNGVKKLTDEEGTFQREPAWTCVKINGRSTELILVTYHAIFGSLAERRREVGALDDDLNHDGRKDDVLGAVRASRSGSPDVIVVGDFNLTPPDIATELPTWKDLTTGTGSTLNLTDEITDNLYDHVLIPPDQPSLAALQPAKVLDVRGLAEGDSFFRSVSDHLPIRFTLRAAP
jgi:endonuclease/exonuclease/phosphatase family metal-dependent hydrolase